MGISELAIKVIADSAVKTVNSAGYFKKHEFRGIPRILPQPRNRGFLEGQF